MKTRRKIWWVIEWKPGQQKTFTELARHPTQTGAERQMRGMLKIHSKIRISSFPTSARIVQVEASETRLLVGDISQSTPVIQPTVRAELLQREAA